MPIPNLPSFSVPTNNSKLLKIYRAAAQAAEIAALVAPYINRPVSWRTISSAAFDSINFLSKQGLLSDDVTSALNSSINQITQLQNTANVLQSISQNLTTNNFQQSLFQIETITSTLNSQSSSLSRTADSWVNVIDNNEQNTSISNSSSEIHDSINDLNEYISGGISGIASSLSSMNSFASTLNSLGVDATGTILNVNTALTQINNVANTATAVANIATNLVNTVENVKDIANNIKSIDKFFANKRKGNKEIPKLPAAIDPRNSEYYTIYASINTTIDTLNKLSTSLSSIPKLPFLS
jgi:methyl-accepting chemotaxis protein